MTPIGNWLIYCIYCDYFPEYTFFFCISFDFFGGEQIVLSTLCYTAVYCARRGSVFFMGCYFKLSISPRCQNSAVNRILKLLIEFVSRGVWRMLPPPLTPSGPGGGIFIVCTRLRTRGRHIPREAAFLQRQLSLEASRRALCLSA